MGTAHALLCVNRFLQNIIQNDRPFVGKIVVLGGDFRQVLPVVPHGSRQSTVQQCIKNCSLWQHFKIFKLFTNMRTNQNETNFAQFLLQIGDGGYLRTPVHENEIDNPSRLIEEKDIITEIFGNDISNFNDAITFPKFAILAPKNEHCDEVNNKIVSLPPGDAVEYLSVNMLISENDNNVMQFPTEFLDSLQFNGIPPHSLKLKIGAIVILLRN